MSDNETYKQLQRAARKAQRRDDLEMLLAYVVLGIFAATVALAAAKYIAEAVQSLKL